MASAYASNTINDAINIMINVVNESNQMCQTGFYESGNIDISGNVDSTINIGDIDINQLINMDIQCTQTATAQTSVDNSLSQTISQIAQAINQQFNILPSSTIAINNLNLLTQIGVAIKNSFNQTCKSKLVITDSVNIKNNVNSSVTTGNINFNQDIEAMVSCIQQDSTVNDIKNKIVQNIEQQAEAKVESILGPFIIIMILIIIIIGAILFEGSKGLTDYRVLLVIVLLIIIGIGVAYFLKWWPFNKTTPSS